MDVDARVPALSSGRLSVPIQGSTEINPGSVGPMAWRARIPKWACFAREKREYFYLPAVSQCVIVEVLHHWLPPAGERVSLSRRPTFNVWVFQR